MFAPKKDKGKFFNKPTKGQGKLTRDGKVWKNNLLDTDYTAGMRVARKLK